MIIAQPPAAKGKARAPTAATPTAGALATAVWIDLLDPSEEELRQVEKLAKVRLPTRHELTEIERSSRVAFEDGALRLTAPMIAHEEADPCSLTHVGFVMTKTRLITLRYERLDMFEATQKALSATGPGGGKLTAPQVFVALMQAFVTRQADLLENARARLDAISHHVFRAQGGGVPRQIRNNDSVMREKLRTLGRLGEETSLIRESLMTVDRIVSFAMEAAGGWFSAGQTQDLKTAHDDIGSLALFEEHLLGKIQFLLDAVLGLISIDQNDIFKVLTIASVVGIFPTLVAGWYGMNFHNMPEYGWAYGYQFGIGVIVVSTILPLIWFKWRGWF